MVKETTLYDRLEITSDANEQQIQKAYFKLSKKLHPDKHASATEEERAVATQKFQEINQAKEILLDKEKRELYDRVGMNMFNPEFQEGHQGGNPFNHFSNMFNHGFPFGMGMPQSNRTKPPENITETINVSLEQLYNELPVDITYKHKHYCVKCNGEGTKDGKSSTCNGCDGKGMRVQVVQMGLMMQQSITECPQCKGKGNVIKSDNSCNECTGKGYSYRNRTITVPLKSGLMHGNKVNLSGKGHQLKTTKTDLIITINELTHDLFKRNNDDLFVEVELKLYQALFGFDKIITHMDGRKLHISSSGRTEFNMIRKITGEGMKHLTSNTKGDLYIKFIINIPNLMTLPNETRQQLKSIIQSFDKAEVQTELQVTKTSNLIKTIINDCKAEQQMQLSQMFNNLKLNQTKHVTSQENEDTSDSDDNNQQHQTNVHHQQQVQCAQQ